MNETVWTHIIYLAVAGGVTVWVGRTLQKHGEIFALDGNDDSDGLVHSFSRLLEIGFYLLNFGAISLTLQFGGRATTVESAIEILSTKLGVVLLILGLVHLTMTSVFSNTRKEGGFRRSKERDHREFTARQS